MKFKLLLILILSVLLNCKSYKENRLCRELVSKNKSLELQSYQDLLIHLKVDLEKRRPFSLIIMDGHSITKDSLTNFIENQSIIKILNASILKTSETLHLDDFNSKVTLLLLTNNCFIKK